MKKLKIFAIMLFLTACQTTPSDPLEADFYNKKEAVNAIIQKAKDNKTQKMSNLTLEAQLLALNSKNPHSIISLSKSLYKSGHKKEGLGLLQSGSKLNPEDENLQLELGKSLIQNDRPKEAVKTLQQIKNLKNKDYYNAMGIAHDMTKAHKTAQNYFKEGLKVAPNDALLQNNLALSYILNKEPQKGVTILQKLVKKPDALPKYRHNLAMAYGIMAKPNEARKILEKDLPKKQVEENLKVYKQMRNDKNAE